MKKHLLFFIAAVITLTVSGQSSIPNGDFESWTQGAYSLPQYYPVSSNAEAFFRTNTAFNVLQSTPGYHGAYAVQLNTTITNGDTVFGYFINTQPNGDPTSWHGGMPYSQMPTGIRGYYKYNLASADSGSILVAFSKAGVNIGTYVYLLGGSHSDYTAFNFNFQPALAQAPDSMVVAAISCKFSSKTKNPVPTAAGSLTLDSISLKGVNSQPAQLNGDFENWQNKTVYKPDSWFYDGDDQGDGLFRSSNAEKGNYALELVTYAGNNNNKMVAQPGSVSTAYYNNSCNCMQGGYPYSRQIDTLAFYYKYTPSGNDSALISLSFKKNGADLWQNGINLHTASSYQYKEFPFNLGSAPDSVIISIQSSNYTDTALSFVGSDLLIDQIHFKSQPFVVTGIQKTANNNLSIYPNPTSSFINIQDNGFNAQSLEIYNIQGKRVFAKSYLNPLSINKIDLSQIEKGIYFIKIYGSTQVHTEKIVIQ
jgi:Secretion system C-terminal sorting domain